MKFRDFFCSFAVLASLCLLPCASVFGLTADGAPQAGQVQEGYSPEAIRTKYFSAWERFFGARPPVREDFIAPDSASSEQVFQYLWLSSRPTIPSRERQVVLGALRYKVLDDPTAVVETLNRLAERGRFSSADFHGVLLYIFLDEDVTDPTFLHETLPTSGSLSKIQGALRSRGIAWCDFVARFEAWAISKVLEAALLESPALVPPSVWGLDRGLEPGGFSVVKIVGGELSSGVMGQMAGDADGRLRMLAISAGPGHASEISLFAPPAENMGFAAGENEFYLAVLNPEFEPVSTGGIAMTFWNSFEPFFEVKQSSVDDSACSLTIEEQEVVSSYTLLTQAPEGGPFGQVGDAFLSAGGGANRYRITLPSTPASGSIFRLMGRLNTGSEISVDLNPEIEKARTETGR